MPRIRSPKGSKTENKDLLNTPAAVSAAPEVPTEAPEAQQSVQSETVNQKTEIGESRPRTEPRRRVLAKTDSRMGVVPINVEDEIRRRAYEIYAGRGFANGHETEDWLSAEREVMQRYRQHSA